MGKKGAQPEEITVKVAVKVRPLSQKEKNERCNECITFHPTEAQVILGEERAFTYDYAFSSAVSQKESFEACCMPLMLDWFNGWNVTVLAYGQTGAGKSFTMGSANNTNVPPEHLGVIPRAFERIFAHKKQWEGKVNMRVRASFLELYNEEIRDMLIEDPINSKPLQIREDKKRGVYVDKLRAIDCATQEEIEAYLTSGSLNRTTGSTLMNSESSRSHAVFTVVLEQDPQITPEMTPEEIDALPVAQKVESYFNFVDLAGSERAKRTGATGSRLKEGININGGLLALGNVISALGDAKRRKQHIPYRDSKLTRLLQDSLGGNSRTLMIACCSPADSNFEETLNTLKYADRAKNIKNKPVKNLDPMSLQLAALRKQVAELTAELKRYKQASGELPPPAATTTTAAAAAPAAPAAGGGDGAEGTAAAAAALAATAGATASAAPTTPAGSEGVSAELSGAAGGAVNNEEVIQAFFDLKSELSTLQFENKVLDDQHKKATARIAELNQRVIRLQAERELDKIKMEEVLLAAGRELDHTPFDDERDTASLAQLEVYVGQIEQLRTQLDGTEKELRGTRAKLKKTKKQARHAAYIASVGVAAVDDDDEEVKERREAAEALYQSISDDESDEDDDDEEEGADGAGGGALSDSDDEDAQLSAAERMYRQEQRELEFLKKQQMLGGQISTLTQTISAKEQLVNSMSQNTDELERMKADAARKQAEIEEEMRQIEEEKKKLEEAEKEMSEEKKKELKRIRKEYEKKMHKLKGELDKYKKKEKEHMRLIKIQEKNLKQMDELKREINGMRKQKESLVGKMKAEGKKRESLMKRDNKQLKALKAQTQKQENKIAKLLREKKRADELLQRRTEEKHAAQKKLLEMSRNLPRVAAHGTRGGSGAGGGGGADGEAKETSATAGGSSVSAMSKEDEKKEKKRKKKEKRRKEKEEKAKKERRRRLSDTPDVPQVSGGGRSTERHSAWMESELKRYSALFNTREQMERERARREKLAVDIEELEKKKHGIMDELAEMHDEFGSKLKYDSDDDDDDDIEERVLEARNRKRMLDRELNAVTQDLDSLEGNMTYVQGHIKKMASEYNKAEEGLDTGNRINKLTGEEQRGILKVCFDMVLTLREKERRKRQRIAELEVEGEELGARVHDLQAANLQFERRLADMHKQGEEKMMFMFENVMTPVVVGGGGSGADGTGLDDDVFDLVDLDGGSGGGLGGGGGNSLFDDLDGDLVPGGKGDGLLTDMDAKPSKLAAPKVHGKKHAPAAAGGDSSVKARKLQALLHAKDEHIQLLSKKNAEYSEQNASLIRRVEELTASTTVDARMLEKLQTENAALKKKLVSLQSLNRLGGGAFAMPSVSVNDDNTSGSSSSSASGSSRRHRSLRKNASSEGTDSAPSSPLPPSSPTPKKKKTIGRSASHGSFKKSGKGSVRHKREKSSDRNSGDVFSRLSDAASFTGRSKRSSKSSKKQKNVGDAGGHPALIGHTGAVLDVKMYGTFAFTAGADHNIKIWELNSLKELGDLGTKKTSGDSDKVAAKHQGDVNTLCVCDEYNMLVSGGKDRHIKVWSLRTFDCVRTFTVQSEVNVLKCIGKHLVCGMEDSTIRIFDLEKMSPFKTIRQHDGSIFAIEGNDKYLFTAARDSSINMFLMPRFEYFATMQPPHLDGVNALALLGDEQLFSGSRDRSMREWDLDDVENEDTGVPSKLVQDAHTDWVTALAYTEGLPSEEPVVMSGSRDGFVKFWDSKSLGLWGSFQAHKSGVTAMATASNVLLTASADKTVKVWQSSNMWNKHHKV